jgi:hypothetical protein
MYIERLNSLSHFARFNHRLGVIESGSGHFS